MNFDMLGLITRLIDFAWPRLRRVFIDKSPIVAADGGAQPNYWRRWFGDHRRHIAIVFLLTVCAVGTFYWRFSGPSPGAIRILIADIDQRCPDQKQDFKRDIRRELQHEAAKVGVKVEVRLLDSAIRSDETRESARALLKWKRGHILIWGDYACTSTDVQVDIRAEWSLPGVDQDLFVGTGTSYQAKLSELSEFRLQNVTAKSLTGLVLFLLALSDWTTGNEDGALVKFHESIISLDQSAKISPLYLAAPERRLSALAHFHLGLIWHQREEFRQAAYHYQQASGYFPAESHHNWAVAMSGLARKTSGEDAKNLFEEARKKFDIASKFTPNNSELHYNWGNALDGLGRLHSGDRATEFWLQAICKYELAAWLNPNDYRVYVNWGNVLDRLAELRPMDEGVTLWDDALSKYSKAIQLVPHDPLPVANSGLVVHHIAQRTPYPEAEELWSKALRLYSEALRIDADYYDALYNSGGALLNLAQNKSGPARTKIYQEAERVLRRAEAVRPGSAGYNLACLMTLQNKREQARGYLDMSLRTGRLPFRSHLEKDVCFDSIRKESWFADILAAAKP
ncbi:MAG: tetratricopeptide repeat protein [Bryobacteraceae bacterium]|nr:tetratricopeptide repeat protein [Bryobacteraceae bacterium]